MRVTPAQHRRPADGHGQAMALGPRLLVVIAALLLAAGGWAVAFTPDADLPLPIPAGPPVADAEPAWAQVLAALDQRRAAAWRRGDPVALRTVYLAGSPLLDRDRAALRAYLRRGWRVTGVRTSYDVVSATPARDGVVRLVVVDRLARPTAVALSGDRQRLLPRDAAERHVVVLRRMVDGWRIAAIRSR